MKKVLSIFAITLLTLGMFSCEAETDVQDTEALVNSIGVDGDQQSTDGTKSSSDGRGGGN